MATQWRRVCAVGLIGVLAAGTLSGCGVKQGPSTSSASASATVSAPAMDAIPDLGAEASGIAPDVTLAACSVKKGAAQARGTVKNSASESRDVVVAVHWIGANGKAVSIRTFVQKKLDAGAQQSFDLAATLPADALRCVVTARAAKAGTLA